MKLDAPLQYLGKKQPRVRVWLTQIECYMHLMRYGPTNLLDVVAMCVEGPASSWLNATLQDVAIGRKPTFCPWTQCKETMV